MAEKIEIENASVEFEEWVGHGRFWKKVERKIEGCKVEFIKGKFLAKITDSKGNKPKQRKKI